MDAYGGIVGPTKRMGGTSGTITLANGGKILHIWCHCTSAGSVAFPDGMGGTCTVTIPASTVFQLDAMHLAMAVKAGGTVVFTTTDGFYLEWME